MKKKEIKSVLEIGKQFSDATIIMHEAIARRAGLSGTDHKYLGLLTQGGSMTAGDLACLTNLTTGAVTGLIDRLESKKLVKRVYDKIDRRKVIIEPQMEKTEQLLAPVSTTLQSRMVDLIDKFTEQEKEVIENFLLQAIETMQAFTAELNTQDNNE